MKFRKLNKKSLLILFVLLFVILLGGGIYLYIKNVSESQTPKLDKYSDILNWCDSNNSDGNLYYNCKALLLNISSNDSESCFETEIISNNKRLEDFIICESNGNLTYTNEILAYKRLMPIEINMKYGKTGILNNYSFLAVSMKELKLTDIENIVNTDVATLSQMEANQVTSIKNSVNHCPSPSLLPDYVFTENKLSYENFYNTYKTDLSIDDILSYKYYNWENSEIFVLFNADSQNVLSNSDFLPLIKIKLTDEIRNSLLLPPRLPKFNEELDNTDKMLLKQISAVYDSSSIINDEDKDDYIEYFIKTLSEGHYHEEVFCGLKTLLSRIDSKDQLLDNYVDYMNGILLQNLSSLSSIRCANTLPQDILNDEGKYIKFSFNDNAINRCINLNSFVNTSR